MEILEVINKKLLDLFLDAPNHILGACPRFISPIRSTVKDTLNPDKNPLWKSAERKLFVVLKDGRALGTIAAVYHSRHKDFNHCDAIYFGYLHFVEDAEVLTALLNTVRAYARNKGVKSIIGPLNPSINYELGVLTEGFEYEPFFMMNYNPPYYPALLEQMGAQVAMQFFAYQYRQGINPDKIERVAHLIRKRYPVKIEDVDFKKFKEEAVSLCEVYNDAFEGHFGFVPFSREGFVFLANALRPVMDRRLLFKIKFENEIAGFMLTIPDINGAVKQLKNGRFDLWKLMKFLFCVRKVRSSKVMLIAIRKRYQKFGLGSILYTEMNIRTQKAGFDHGEISWVAEENSKMQKVIESIGARPYKKYAVYQIDV